MILTLGCTVVGLGAAGYVGFIRLDTYHLLVNELNHTNNQSRRFLDVLSFLFAIHEGQVITLSTRCLCIPAAFQAFSRGCLLYVMSKKSPSIWTIRLYSEIRVVSASLRNFEKTLSGSFFSLVFWFAIVGTGTLYIGIRQNNILMAVPSFLIASIAIVFLQFFFLFGPSFYKFSTIMLGKWKGDRQLCFGNRKDCAYFKRLIKSLRPISMPAGTIGIIDNEIKVNYFKYLFESMVNTVLTLKDIF